MLDRLEREIDKLDTIASSAYKKFSKRNTTLADEFSKVTQEIELQQKAYDAYIYYMEDINACDKIHINFANTNNISAYWISIIKKMY